MERTFTLYRLPAHKTLARRSTIISWNYASVSHALAHILIGRALTSFLVISACKTGSAKRVTAVLPLFPYSRQPDLPYNKAGAPLNKAPSDSGKYTFESVPATPGPGLPRTDGLSSGIDITKMLAKASLAHNNSNNNGAPRVNGDNAFFGVDGPNGRNHASSISSVTGAYTTHDYENPQMINAFQAKPGYKQWVAQAGTLVADLLTCAGADHVRASYLDTMDFWID